MRLPRPTIAAMEVIDWLLEGDPAIRWQVLRALQELDGQPAWCPRGLAR